MCVQLLQNIYIYIRFTLNINVWLDDFFFTWIKKNSLSHYTLCYISVITVHMLKIIGVE